METINILWIFMAIYMFIGIVCMFCMAISHKNVMIILMNQPIDNRGVFQKALNSVGIKNKAKHPDQSEERKLEGKAESYNYEV